MRPLARELTILALLVAACDPAPEKVPVVEAGVGLSLFEALPETGHGVAEVFNGPQGGLFIACAVRFDDVPASGFTIGYELTVLSTGDVVGSARTTVIDGDDFDLEGDHWVRTGDLVGLLPSMLDGLASEVIELEVIATIPDQDAVADTGRLMLSL